jgi:phosphoribosylanthranilate isomerase
VKSSLIPLFQDRQLLWQSLDYYEPDIIHFCDSLTDDRGRPVALQPFRDSQAELRERFPRVRIMRSIPIPLKGTGNRFPTLDIAAALEPVSDLFLTDTWLGREPVEGYIGITGQTCDWVLANRLVQQSRIPVILAGGMSPENVVEGLRQVGPAGVDSCTLTNRRDSRGNPIRFQKDFDFVRTFIENIRGFSI